MYYMIGSTRQKKPEGWLPIGQLAKRAGVTKATIHHYVQMGLLPEPVKTNPRRAYYDPSWAERIRFIKELQERRFMPLAAIKRVLQDSAEEGVKEVDRMLLADYAARRRFSKGELLQRYPVGEEVFQKLVEIGLLPSYPSSLVGETADERVFCEEEANILEGVWRMREAGLNECIGFLVDDLKIYGETVSQLINREFALFNEKVLGRIPPREVSKLALLAIRHSSQILSSLHYRMLLKRLENIQKKEES